MSKTKHAIIFPLVIALILSASIFSACSSQAKIEEGKFPNTVAENANISPEYKQIAEELKDFTIAEFMDNIAKIPRKSGDVEQITNYVYNFGIKNNIATTKDQSGCVYYDIPATESCENYPLTILQAHMDMVHSTADPSIDMSKAPIDLVYDQDQGLIQSRDLKTNIGADDAEGMTALMGLAINKNYKHGPLRMLFTYDEETTMQGAIKLSPEVLNATYLINVDSGPVGTMCISSAGILKAEITKNYTTSSDDSEVLKTEIKGLKGGHSGIEITQDRLSANEAVAKICKKLKDNNIVFKFVSIDGGEASNIISKSAEFTIQINSADFQNVQNLMKGEFDSLVSSHSQEDSANIDFSTLPKAKVKTLSVNDSLQLVDILNDMPQGVKAMDKQFTDKASVSSNIGTVELKDGKLKIIVHCRSNVESGNNDYDELFKQAEQKYSVKYTVVNRYNGWESNKDSKLITQFSDAMKNTCHFEGCTYMTHGGLECSRFLEKNPNLQMIAIGMDVSDEHNVTEALHTKSIPAFYASLVNFLEKLE